MGNRLGLGAEGADSDGSQVTRRTFMGYLIAAPTLIAAAELVSAPPASAAVPTVQLVDHYDLSDLLNDSHRPTENMITVEVNRDGTVSFALPRAEVGQGLTTAIAMIIADEIGMPVEKVHMTLADSRAELLWNQLTGGSNSVHGLYTPVRTAAATARDQMKSAAAQMWGQPESELSIEDGVVAGPGGRRATFGELTERAAASRTRPVNVTLKPAGQFKVIGRAQGRIDARAAVTGHKVFAMDLHVPGALPTMLCPAPTINPSARRG